MKAYKVDEAAEAVKNLAVEMYGEMESDGDLVALQGNLQAIIDKAINVRDVAAEVVEALGGLK